MDAFQWWEELWNPIAKPTADLGAEALRKYQAGEIDFTAYQAAVQKNNQLNAGIADAKADYAIYAANNPIDVGSVLQPVTDFTKNLAVVLMIGAALYFLVLKKRLEA